MVVTVMKERARWIRACLYGYIFYLSNPLSISPSAPSALGFCHRASFSQQKGGSWGFWSGIILDTSGTTLPYPGFRLDIQPETVLRGPERLVS